MTNRLEFSDLETYGAPLLRDEIFEKKAKITRNRYPYFDECLDEYRRLLRRIDYTQKILQNEYGSQKGALSP
jgi:AAA+ ATPase superfamily predicted ATPase